MGLALQEVGGQGLDWRIGRNSDFRDSDAGVSSTLENRPFFLRITNFTGSTGANRRVGVRKSLRKFDGLSC